MIIQEVILIFLLGSIFAWIFEFLKNILVDKKITNPGFLKGPYLPLYGTGTIIILLISYLEINLFFKIILFLIFPTLLELLVGEFFLKKKIRLWDYSKKDKLHYKGIICFSSSLFWLTFSLFFYFFIFPSFQGFVIALWDKTIIKILILTLYIIILLDFKKAIKK